MVTLSTSTSVLKGTPCFLQKVRETRKDEESGLSVRKETSRRTRTGHVIRSWVRRDPTYDHLFFVLFCSLSGDLNSMKFGRLKERVIRTMGNEKSEKSLGVVNGKSEEFINRVPKRGSKIDIKHPLFLISHKRGRIAWC